MKPLKLLETSDTPEVTLDKERGRFEFYGNIMPENPKEFFDPIIEWFHEYVKNPNPETTLIFKLDYFNTAASKKLIEILSILQGINQNNKTVQVNWFYKKIDEDMRDSGETFAEIIHIPFKFFTY
ncbi:MAG TPA: nuclear pore complex subunit [Bacteroidales bacterium]|jgi:hypothetical protein|nr:nuclear pore complex subunit [Bacteroidales bacterium]